MATRFRLYSTDIQPTLTPDLADPAPALNIAWDRDPIENGIQETPPEGRGSVIETGDNGIVVHDFGVPDGGGTLAIQGNAQPDGEFLTPETVALFRAAYKAADVEYFLTDGIRCWRVRWSRKPAGFNVWMNQFWAQHGVYEYSYEFVFIVMEEPAL
jgi:hypothetical protein